MHGTAGNRVGAAGAAAVAEALKLNTTITSIAVDSECMRLLVFARALVSPLCRQQRWVHWGRGHGGCAASELHAKELVDVLYACRACSLAQGGAPACFR